MAKKRKTSSEAKKNTYSVEMIGLILILIGVIGFGFGPVGALLKKFAMFLMGEWWPAILIFVLFLGFYMLIKRKLPTFFSAKHVGFYLLIMVILTLSHLTFIKNAQTPKAIFDATMNNYMSRVASIGASSALASSGQSSIVIGGGIIGALLAFGSASLFGLNGTYIVLAFVALFGLILFFNVNLSNVLNSFIEKIKDMRNTVGEDEDDEDEITRKEKALEKRLAQNEVEEESPKTIVVSSVEELKQRYDTSSEAKLEETTTIDTSKIVNSNPNYQLPEMKILDDPVKSKKVNSN
ncbi:MAG: hypothetical protein IJ704_04290, partial [Bacilli bacterium]|nr:hypothetical protein [Bacilli bacterium]